MNTDPKEKDRENQTYKDLMDILYSVTHDLKSPLMSIEGFSRILMEDSQIEEKEKAHFLHRILVNIGFMDTLIQNLLDYIKFQNIPSEELNLEKIDENRLEELIQELFQKKIEKMAEPAASLDLKLNKEGNTFSFDLFWFQRMMDVLLDNAIKYSKPREEAILIRSEPKAKPFQIQIINWGTEIPPEEREKIFQILYQGKNQPAGKKGSGIGLTLARLILEKHGGGISVGEIPKKLKDPGKKATAILLKFPP